MRYVLYMHTVSYSCCVWMSPACCTLRARIVCVNWRCLGCTVVDGLPGHVVYIHTARQMHSHYCTFGGAQSWQSAAKLVLGNGALWPADWLLTQVGRPQCIPVPVSHWPAGMHSLYQSENVCRSTLHLLPDSQAHVPSVRVRECRKCSTITAGMMYLLEQGAHGPPKIR